MSAWFRVYSEIDMRGSQESCRGRRRRDGDRGRESHFRILVCM